MTIDRAIEICNPTTESTHSPSEWFQAHNMACQALALLRWKDAVQEPLVVGLVVLHDGDGPP